METLTVVLQQQILKLLCQCDRALSASNRGRARSKDEASSARARAHYFERYKLYSKLLPRLKGRSQVQVQRGDSLLDGIGLYLQTRQPTAVDLVRAGPAQGLTWPAIHLIGNGIELLLAIA